MQISEVKQTFAVKIQNSGIYGYQKGHPNMQVSKLSIFTGIVFLSIYAQEQVAKPTTSIRGNIILHVYMKLSSEPSASNIFIYIFCTHT